MVQKAISVSGMMSWSYQYLFLSRNLLWISLTRNKELVSSFSTVLNAIVETSFEKFPFFYLISKLNSFVIYQVFWLGAKTVSTYAHEMTACPLPYGYGTCAVWRSQPSWSRRNLSEPLPGIQLVPAFSFALEALTSICGLPQVRSASAIPSQASP